jgi:hypothetical protein
MLSAKMNLTGFTSRFPQLNMLHVTRVPEKAIFPSVTVYNKIYPVNAIYLLKENQSKIRLMITNDVSEQYNDIFNL